MKKMNKAELINRIQENAANIHTAEELKAMTMKDLNKLLQTLKENTETTEEENKEENMNKEQEKKATEKAAEKTAVRDAHIDLVLNTVGQALFGNAEADVYPNLSDWIKIKLGGKTILEARFGKKDLRVQAAEDVAKEAGVTYNLVMSFSKPATMFLQYDADGMNQLDALIGAADTVAAKKLMEKEAKEAEKRLAKEAEKEAKAKAKAEAKAKKEAAKKAKEEAKAE